MIPPLSPLLAGPAGLLIEKLVLDFDLIELILRFPEMNWGELGASLAAILGWKWLGDQIDRWIMPIARVWLADRLAALAEMIKP